MGQKRTAGCSFLDTLYVCSKAIGRSNSMGQVGTVVRDKLDSSAPRSGAAPLNGSPTLTPASMAGERPGQLAIGEPTPRQRRKSAPEGLANSGSKPILPEPLPHERLFLASTIGLRILVL